MKLKQDPRPTVPGAETQAGAGCPLAGSPRWLGGSSAGMAEDCLRPFPAGARPGARNRRRSAACRGSRKTPPGFPGAYAEEHPHKLPMPLVQGDGVTTQEGLLTQRVGWSMTQLHNANRAPKACMRAVRRRCPRAPPCSSPPRACACTDEGDGRNRCTIARTSASSAPRIRGASASRTDAHDGSSSPRRESKRDARAPRP